VRTKRRLRARILLLAGASLFSVIGLEFLLRILAIAPPDPTGYVGQYENSNHHFFIPDPWIGWRMAPKGTFTWQHDGTDVTYEADDLGFRKGRSIAHEAATYKVAIVGDSNSWGYGVPASATYGALLDEGRDDVAVSNFAMCGFGLDQVWQTLVHYALPSRPNLVVVGIVEDDFQRSLRVFRRMEGFNKPTFTRTAGTLRQLTASDRPSFLVDWADEHCHIWAAANRLMQRIGHNIQVGEWWSLNALILDNIRADCAAAGVTVVFLWIPEGASMASFPSLENYMKNCGAEFVNPLRWPATGPAEALFRERHLTILGHRWIASALKPHVDRCLPSGH
jgi:hypothetical protein